MTNEEIDARILKAYREEKRQKVFLIIFWIFVCVSIMAKFL
jgi:hypothetical protein